MNELFHVISSIGITAGLTDTEQRDDNGTLQNILPVIVSVFSIGIILHGLLDYLPHTYPVKPKVDVIVSIILAFIIILLSKRPYRSIVISSLSGCILPDIIDLGPKMVNAYFGLGLPIYDQLFPWHWKSYSGSLYNEGYAVSAINHTLIFLALLIVFWTRRKHLKNIFSRR